MNKNAEKELAQRMFQRDPRSRAAGQVQAPIIPRSIAQKLYLYIYNKFKKKKQKRKLGYIGTTKKRHGMIEITQIRIRKVAFVLSL